MTALDDNGLATLLAAAEGGHVNCVQELLQHQFMAEFLEASNHVDTALMVAVSAGHVDCMEELLLYLKHAC
eukprot:364409-Chlamydomonas_euryale.AAC.14